MMVGNHRAVRMLTVVVIGGAHGLGAAVATNPGPGVRTGRRDVTAATLAPLYALLARWALMFRSPGGAPTHQVGPLRPSSEGRP